MNNQTDNHSYSSISIVQGNIIAVVTVVLSMLLGTMLLWTIYQPMPKQAQLFTTLAVIAEIAEIAEDEGDKKPIEDILKGPQQYAQSLPDFKVVNLF